MSFYHEPVMLNEVVASLSLAEQKDMFGDVTGGGGGHADAVIGQTGVRKAIVIDRDPDAVTVLQDRFSNRPNVLVSHGKMSEIDRLLFLSGEASFDMLLADLGVSSYQLDTEGRGFSWKFDEPLDLRMNPDEGETAIDMIRRLTVAELQQLFSEHAQERESKRVAIALKRGVVDEGLRTTGEIKECMLRAKRFHRTNRDDAAPLFMALRIAVNNEVGEMETFLRHGFIRLSTGGVMAVITFHSGEERVVKRVFREIASGQPILDPRLEQAVVPGPVTIFRKITPSPDEISRNPRSRSAALFVLKKGVYNKKTGKGK